MTSITNSTATTTETPEQIWDRLNHQSEDVFPGEEYEVPQELFCYMKLFDSQGRYATDAFPQQDLSFLGGIPLEDSSRRDLHLHPGIDGFFRDAVPPAKDLVGWYDVVLYFTAIDDGYRNGRSNEGLMRIEESDNGKITLELRPTAQMALADYCGLYYTAKEVSRSERGDILNLQFQAPERFAPDMQVDASATMRIIDKKVATGLDLDERGDHPDYGKHIPLETAKEMMDKHEHPPSKKHKHPPSNESKFAPIIFLEPGDVVISTQWVHCRVNKSEIGFVARKRAS